MLADTVRTEAYQAAIDEVVRPGMRVLDLGTGTGVLALMAARRGAVVDAVDIDPMVRHARRIAEVNGLADRITFHEGDSRGLDLGPVCDLVVSECMGNFFVTDEMQGALADARRFLKPGGRFVPERIDLLLAPAFIPQLREVEFWQEVHYGLRFDPLLEPARNQCYVHHVPRELLIGPATPFARIDVAAMRQDLEGRVSLTVDRALTLHGVVGWFDAQLTPSVCLTTAPGAPTTHWAQTIFPVPPTPVRPGDAVDLDLSIGHTGDRVQRVRWRGTVRRGGEELASFDLDTDRRFQA